MIMVNVQLISSYSSLLAEFLVDSNKMFINSFGIDANIQCICFQNTVHLIVQRLYYFGQLLICLLGPTLSRETKAFLMFEMEKALETFIFII